MKHPTSALRLGVLVSLFAAFTLVGALLPAAAAPVAAAEDAEASTQSGEATAAQDGSGEQEMPDEAIGHRPCVRGEAGPFRCHQIDLMSFLPPDEWGGGPGSRYGGPGNDVWGWTDPQTGTEWVIMGRSDGTSFVDIDDPKNPVFVADLPKHGETELHSDMKVYQGHAFIVSEADNNGIQVFDLSRLRDIDYADAPVTVDEDAHYDRFDNAHDIAINEDTGFAYAVGTNTCNGGLHMVDIRDPLDPAFAGCFGADGYTHDAQCVVYHGPDVRFQGREICFLSNPGPEDQDRLTVVDVTDKSNPVMLSRTLQGCPCSYSHQGWLTDDHRYFLHNDESDEIRYGGRTRTRIFDTSNLTDVSLHSVYRGETHAADHNLYVKGRYAYLTNYFDGLRVVNITKIDHPGDDDAPEMPGVPDHQGLREVACFDTDPTRDDIPGFGGSWSNYPFFDSGIVAVSGFDGLFILKPRVGGNAAFPPGAGKAPPAGQRGDDSAGDSARCLG